MACSINWEALAAAGALAQAVLTGVAVYAAAKLQDRSIERRLQVARLQKLNAVAFVAQWILGRYDDLAKDLSAPKISTNDFVNLYHPNRLALMLTRLKTFPLLELEDEPLMQAVLTMEDILTRVERLLLGQFELAEISRSALTYVNVAIVAEKRVELFNAVASVERRAAELIGRLPKV